MWQSARESPGVCVAIHVRPVVLRHQDAVQSRGRQLDRLRQLFSPRGAV